jgi:hypothetical protein
VSCGLAKSIEHLHAGVVTDLPGRDHVAGAVGGPEQQLVAIAFGGPGYAADEAERSMQCRPQVLPPHCECSARDRHRRGHRCRLQQRHEPFGPRLDAAVLENGKPRGRPPNDVSAIGTDIDAARNLAGATGQARPVPINHMPPARLCAVDPCGK